MPVIATLAGVLGVVGCWGTPDPTALAVVRAMEIQEQGVRTLRWHQTVTISTPSDEQHVLSESDQVSDRESGGWAWRGRWSGQNGAGDWEEHSAEFATADGVAYWARDASKGRAIVRPSDGERHLYRSPEHLMGRGVDRSGEFTLWESLRRAETLTIEPSGDSRWTLRGITVIANVNVTVEVVADESRRFALCELTIADVLSGVPYDHRVVTEFAVIDGCHVPIKGEFTSWQADMSPMQMSRMNEELAARGLAAKGDPRDPSVRRITREAVEAVFGPLGVPKKPIGVGTMRLACDRVRVNIPTSMDDFCVESPSEEAAFNAYTGRLVPRREVTPASLPVESAPPNPSGGGT